MTGVHQSIDAQKGNPPSPTHHQHHVPPLSISRWKWKHNAVIQEQARKLLPSLGERRLASVRVVRAVPPVWGHQGLGEVCTQSESRAHRDAAAAGGELEGGMKGRRGWDTSLTLCCTHLTKTDAVSAPISVLVKMENIKTITNCLH